MFHVIVSVRVPDFAIALKRLPVGGVGGVDEP
jgi:hypothetical protein